MARSPLTTPPLSNQAQAKTGEVDRSWGRWFFDVYNDVTTLNNRAQLEYIEISADAATLDEGGSITVKSPITTTAQFKVRDIFIVGTGTNFFNQGDKPIIVTDSSDSVVYTEVPAEFLKDLGPARWGHYGIPFPSIAEAMTAASTAGSDIILKYGTGTTEYSGSGSVNFVIVIDQTAE